MNMSLKFVATALLTIPMLALGQEGNIQCPTPVIPPAQKLDSQQVLGQPPESVDLPSVMASVKAAMQCYQDNKGTGADALPTLSSAVFDFKTTTATVGGLSFSIFILKIGATHEVDNISDLVFTYSVPTPTTKGLKKKPSKPLSDELANAILAAAKAVQTSGQLADNLPLSKVAITVQFGVKNDGNVSLSIPVQLVTVGPSFDKNKTSTQSVTLTFGK